MLRGFAKRYLFIALFTLCAMRAAAAGTAVMPTVPNPAPRPVPGFVNVQYNGRYLYFDVKPVIVEGRVLVPFRQVFEVFGAQVEYNGGDGTVTGIRGNVRISLTIGEKEAWVNEKPILLDVPATVIDARTLIPLRFVSESLGAGVEWDDARQTAIITGY